jgi:hypothetical protein
VMGGVANMFGGKHGGHSDVRHKPSRPLGCGTSASLTHSL